MSRASKPDESRIVLNEITRLYSTIKTGYDNGPIQMKREELYKLRAESPRRESQIEAAELNIAEHKARIEARKEVFREHYVDLLKYVGRLHDEVIKEVGDRLDCRTEVYYMGSAMPYHADPSSPSSPSFESILSPHRFDLINDNVAFLYTKKLENQKEMMVYIHFQPQDPAEPLRVAVHGMTPSGDYITPAKINLENSKISPKEWLEEAVKEILPVKRKVKHPILNA